MRTPDWIKRDDREPSSLAGSIELSDGHVVNVQISNLSSVGCRVECDDVLPIGQTVELQVGVKVRWALDGAAGLRLKFSNPAGS